jgi:RHS repeat-associated protein
MDGTVDECELGGCRGSGGWVATVPMIHPNYTEGAPVSRFWSPGNIDTMQARVLTRKPDTSTTPPHVCLFSAASGHRSISTGKERDAESGNDYFGARYYASTMGRWLSPDRAMTLKRILPNPQRWNRYAYVINNPLVNFDPDGMDDFKVFLNFLPGNIDARSQKQADAQWSQIAATARQNGHTVEFVKPTVDNYATALQSGSHVIDVGHSLVDPHQQDKAYGINMSGDPNLFVGTNTVEPTMDTMPLNTLLTSPGITAPSVDIFSCNSADLSDAYISDGAHLFTGISSGPNGTNDLTAIGAGQAFLQLATSKPSSQPVDLQAAGAAAQQAINASKHPEDAGDSIVQNQQQR